MNAKNTPGMAVGLGINLIRDRSVVGRDDTRLSSSEQLTLTSSMPLTKKKALLTYFHVD